MRSRSRIVENLVEGTGEGFVARIGDRVLKRGDKVKDFRGETDTFLYVSRGPEPGRSAKVVVKTPGKNGWEREFYAEVFDIVVTPAGRA